MTAIESTCRRVFSREMLLVLAIVSLLLIHGGLMAQFCDQPQGGAGFPTDPTCQNAVCAADPFCCSTSWDGLCANLAATLAACSGCLSTAGGGGSGCINTAQFGAAAVPTTNNNVVTISTCNWQTEYSVVSGFVAGQTYTAGSSCGGYITVRSGTFNGPVVAAGNAPLTFVASVTGTYFIHYNTSAACGTATFCCTTTIQCTTCAVGCVVGAGCAVQPPACVTDCLAWQTVVNNDFFCCNSGWDALCENAYNNLSTSCTSTGGGGGGGSCAPGVGGSAFAGFGPIQIQQNLSPQQLITDVFLGECLSASNIVYSGATSALGTFSNGWAIGIESGIILTSGNAALAVGPNDQGGAGAINGTPGHPLLTIAAGAQTYDAAVFTFTFVPQTESVTFTYVFASEEYPEWVCSTYNDAFGFFVSGPGYAPNTNIAIIPGTTAPVTINNVNNNGAACPPFYPAFYVDNTWGQSVQYDGFTVPLTACINTVPCEAYTITIAVADAGDGVLDSAVFLEAESFSAGTELEIVASVDQNLANVSSGTNCDENGFFVFQLNEPSTEPVTLVYNIEVDGPANVDPVALTVTFAPGQTTVAIPVSADAVGTSLTTVTLSMSSADNPGLGCSCEVTEMTSTLYLCDLLLLLPVTWLDFTAKSINDDREVRCDWITAAEINNDYFAIERSADKVTWHDIGTIAGGGSTNDLQYYTFIDHSPLNGTSYYRLRQNDFNGEKTFSEVRSVTRSKISRLNVYPNPGSGVFRLSGYEDGDLYIYDLSGRQVPFSLLPSGELRIHNVAAGVYMIELKRPEEGTSERIRLVVH